MKRNYWIHAPAGMGKSNLAKTIAGEAAFWCSFHDHTLAAMARIFRSEWHIILDNFHETKQSGFNLQSLIQLPTTYQTLVVISEAPPQGETLFPHFTVIKIESLQRHQS
jgi:hypothetical protein